MQMLQSRKNRGTKSNQDGPCHANKLPNESKRKETAENQSRKEKEKDETMMSRHTPHQNTGSRVMDDYWGQTKVRLLCSREKQRRGGHLIRRPR